MTPTERLDGLRRLGAALDGRDLDCYALHGKDPAEPIIGEGDPHARICLFGRDPGRDEVRLGVPFIGVGGQKLRHGLHRALWGADAPDLDAMIAAGRFVFWANMVPFKPFENKAWPPKVLREFRPFMLDLLANGWHGTDVITLGEGAFKWFGLDGPKPLKQALREHWERDDRFETSLVVPLDPDRDGARPVRLHPLPHPSPLNATWTPHFPRLLDARLRDLGLRVDRWQVQEAR